MEPWRIEPVVFRDEVRAAIMWMADVIVELREIRRLLEAEDEEEAE